MKRNVIPVVILLLASCGSSQQRKQGIDELATIQTAVHGLHILVSAGVTKQEYSQRFEDALLKVGDLGQSAKGSEQKFPRKEQDAVREIYSHLANSSEAYKAARDYFGDKFSEYGCEEGCSTLSQQDYDAEKAKFPTLIQLQPVKAYEALYPSASPSYFRNDMLQALWAVAGAEDDKAKQLIDQLKQQ
jgi:hypothetical protein